MPVTQHPVFKQPADPGIAVWRYMDFTKFMSLLESRALFFARADKLGDPFEGTLSRGNAPLRRVVYKEWYSVLPEEAVEKAYELTAQLRKGNRSWMFINCWHMNSGESAAMWRLYARTNEAVAIRSTYSRLANALDAKTYLGCVEYIDFERDWMPEDNFYYPFVHKRKSFSHELEVRALTMEVPLTADGHIDRDTEPTKVGIEKPVNLDELVEQIYVAPTAPGWFRTLVERVIAQYNLKKPVLQSSLDAEPLL